MSHPPTSARTCASSPSRWRILARHAHTGLALVFALCLAACVDASWPFHRHETAAPASTASSASDSGTESECASIRSQIRASEEQRREAPVTSTDPEIVSASLAKADKRIEDLRSRYAELDCPPERMSQPGRVPPLPPAPAPPPH